jgi:CheY-like chemotaxis protein
MSVVRVLIAEDNEDHLFFTVRALNDLNGMTMEITTVRDGEEALDYIYRREGYEEAQRPHLMLLDLKMPKLDGFGVLERMKQDPDLRTIPVVVLSSSDRPEDIESAYRLGTNSYVTKPVSIGDLKEGMRRIRDFWMTFAELPTPPR